MRQHPRPGSLRAAALAALLLLGGCKVELYRALPQDEANDMLSILLRSGLSASKSASKDGSETITIEQSQFASAVELLRARGFPRPHFQTMGDVFQPSGLIASPLQERARLLWALSQELSGTVSKIDGVLTARVQVVLPDNDLLDRDPTPSSASVFIRYADRSDVTKFVPQIKMLVSNSVQGLGYDKVSVILIPVAQIDAPLPQDQPGWLDATSGPLTGLAVLLSLGAAALAFRRRIATAYASLRPHAAYQPADTADAAPGVGD